MKEEADVSFSRFSEGLTRARFAPGFGSSEPLSTPTQPRNFSIALMWSRAANHKRGAAGAGEHGTTSGQPIRHGSCQHLLLAGSSSWALGRAARRVHPALSRALPWPPEEPLPCAWSCFARVAVGDSSAQGGRRGRKCWAPSKVTIWPSTMRWGASRAGEHPAAP